MITPKLARARPLVVAALVAIGSATGAYAQSVHFIGSTGGCFFLAINNPCAPTVGQDDTYQGLTYTSGAFDVWTNPVTGSASIGSSTLTQSLGSFFLASTVYDYASAKFRLLINFTSPLSPNPDQLFTAALQGSVFTTPGGTDSNVKIVFDTPTLYFGGPNGEQYSVTVDSNRFLTNGGTVYWTGGVTGTTVPEPISMVLLGTGLLGLGAVRRRRKHSA